MRQLLIRAIITGFGLRIGSELAKFVAHRVLPNEDDKKSKEEADEDDSLQSISADPPEI